MEYCCKTCGYKTMLKQNYYRHLKRKIKCQPVADNSVNVISNNSNDNNPQNFKNTPHFDQILGNTQNLNDLEEYFKSLKENRYRCKNCGKDCKQKYNLDRHVKSCNKKFGKEPTDESKINDLVKENQKIRLELEREKEKMNKEREAMKKEQHEMRNDIKKLMSLVNKQNNTTNNTTNNNTHTQNVNIVINNFGNENLDYITEDYLTKIIKHGPRGSIQKLLRQIYFNPNHPENQCVKIPNKKQPYAKVKSNDKWEFKDKGDVVDTMVNKGYGLIDDHYEGIENELEGRYKGKYREFKVDYDNNNTDLIKKIKKETELIIINGSSDDHNPITISTSISSTV